MYVPDVSDGRHRGFGAGAWIWKSQAACAIFYASRRTPPGRRLEAPGTHYFGLFMGTFGVLTRVVYRRVYFFFCTEYMYNDPAMNTVAPLCTHHLDAKVYTANNLHRSFELLMVFTVHDYEAMIFCLIF
jgi:hypothetical protein